MQMTQICKAVSGYLNILGINLTRDKATITLDRRHTLRSRSRKGDDDHFILVRKVFDQPS